MGRILPKPPPIRRPGRTPPPLPSERANLGPVFESPFRSDRERYGEIDLAAPLNEWVDVVSTWVNRARFEPYVYLVDPWAEDVAGDWYVEFDDLALVVYPDTPITVWEEFVNSSSKGMFIHYRCKEEGRSYTLLRAGSRTVTPGHREIQAPFLRGA